MRGVSIRHHVFILFAVLTYSRVNRLGCILYSRTIQHSLMVIYKAAFMIPEQDVIAGSCAVCWPQDTLASFGKAPQTGWTASLCGPCYLMSALSTNSLALAGLMILTRYGYS